MAAFDGRTTVVTGGAGFIGSHLVDRLVELGANVIVVDDLSCGLASYVNHRATLLKADVVENSAAIAEALRTAHYLFHLAASATSRESSMGWSNPVYDLRVNALGTLKLLQLIASVNPSCKFILASSAAVYGEPCVVPIPEAHPTNPISPYGVSKLTAEKFCLAFHRTCGLDTLILRIFNTYGPRQRRYVMFDLLRKLTESSAELEVLGTGQQIRDYCYVSDTVEAFVLTAAKQTDSSVVNVGGGAGITIREVAQKILRMRGLEGKTGLVFTGKSWPGDIGSLVADVKLLEHTFGFRPRVPLQQGLRELGLWFDAHENNEMAV